MASCLLDSSAVAKLYHAEAGSPAVEKLVLHSGATILVSRLTVVEVQSAFAGKVRSGVISASEAAVLRHRFFEDIANGVFKVVALRSDHYQEAGALIERHGASRRLCTLDSLQLAVALDLLAQGAIGQFVTADRVLCEVAPREGLSVVDPERS